MSNVCALDCVCFTLIIDDIVLPDGRTCMQQLGGGGPQTLFGFQLVTGQSTRVGLTAGMGEDLPQNLKDWLERIGTDTSGLVLHPRPTPRAWQVFEADGRRTQVWRGRGDPCDELYEMLRPKLDRVPQHFKQARNYHIGVHPLHPPLRLLRALRQAAHESGGRLSVEPYTAAEQPATPEQVSHLLSVCDIFSPNEMEMESMVGAVSPEEGVARLLEAAGPSGASIVVLRRGEHGVLAAAKAGAAEQEAQFEAVVVPAVEDTDVIDVTGCGNAFCGGFLASLDRTGDLEQSARWGCVAASFMAEEYGVPTTPIPQLQSRAKQRFEALGPRTQRLHVTAPRPGSRPLTVSANACAARHMQGLRPKYRASMTCIRCC